MSDSWDAIVVGGGPAGAATAITAARLGCRVLVLEADSFPRHHVGESMIDLWEVFEALGVTEEMDRTFQHKPGSTRIWGREPVPYSLNFDYLPTRRYSLQVERSEFDRILLDRAETVGATVRQGHHVHSVLWEGDRAVGVSYRTADGHEADARAPLVIDGTGRQGFLGRQLGIRTVDPFYPDFSVYGYFRGFRHLDEERTGNLVIEVIPWGWVWFIPLHTGVVSVGMICDRTTRAILRRTGMAAYLHEGIAQTQMVRDLLAQSTMVQGPLGISSYGYQSTRYAGPGWMLVGDAGSFTDPMWSLGVANAFQDGLLAGAIVAALVDGGLDEDSLMAEYNHQAGQRVTYYHAAVKAVYLGNRVHGDGPFWQERHRFPERDTPALESLCWLPINRAGPYFYGAFKQLDLPESVIALFQKAEQGGEEEAAAELLTQQPGEWVPHFPPHVHLRAAPVVLTRPGVGPQSVVPGVALRQPGNEIHVGDPYAVQALQLVDGRRTCSEIFEGVLASVPADRRLGIYASLLSNFRHARREGIMTAQRRL